MTNLEIKKIFEKYVPEWISPGDHILLVVPDTTRTAPMAQLLELLLPILLAVETKITILIALGTHPPLPLSELRKHLGSAAFVDGVRILNHEWNNPDAMMSIGTLSADEIAVLSGGLMTESVDLRVNKEITVADRMLFLHPVFPHELVGFSGGSKYLFPGISGSEMIDIIHWLGALCTSSKAIGQIDTPSRHVLDAAAAKMPLPMHGLSFVYHAGEVVTMEAGGLYDAWHRAAMVSQRVHIIYKSHRFHKVLACCPTMYPDLWTGGKCVYKCAPVVEDGGELIVYAPHVTSFSETHNTHIQALGYHLRDYFIAHADRYKHLPRAVMAYCAIIKGDGTYENGIEYPRIRITFASQIPKKTCEAAGIGYINPASITPAKWMNRESDGVLCVEHAGEMLYRVSNQKNIKL